MTMSAFLNALFTTPLHAHHKASGARLVPFAGYEMPVQYEGVLAEHLWTRRHAGLFDVSHMGQAVLRADDHKAAAKALEALTPANLQGLAPGRQVYTQLLNAEGGIVDDLMVTRSAVEGGLSLVVNSSRKVEDYLYIGAHLPSGIALEPQEDKALLALQGPKAVEVLAAFDPHLHDMPFMSARTVSLGGIGVHISRSGYTGEDGFELSVPASEATDLWSLLLQSPHVKPVGLGARDSLRLEAGLCLYGHDIDETTSPVEAGLAWSIGRNRRQEGGFPGFDRIRREWEAGPARRRVGILPEGRAPAREGSLITDERGCEIGILTSGGYGPSLGAPLAMGYVANGFESPGTRVSLLVRGKPLPARIASLPFVLHRYKRREPHVG